MPFNLDDEYQYIFVFVGNKIANPQLSDSYKNAFLNILKLLKMSSYNDTYFGPEAFKQWAKAIESDFYNIPQDGFDCWRVYSIYICNLF